ncbi:hypothetical protein BK799_31450 [Rhodococcus sp. D-1]|nr:hypothetical protein BK799_31450 [Rhodococcus sp. D-1]
MPDAHDRGQESAELPASGDSTAQPRGGASSPFRVYIPLTETEANARNLYRRHAIRGSDRLHVWLARHRSNSCNRLGNRSYAPADLSR